MRVKNMGIKGKIAWNFMTEKVSQKLVTSMYEFIFSEILQSTSNPEEINQKLKDAGEFMGERLLTDYAERIRQHAAEFHEFTTTLKLAYKVNVGHEPSSIKYIKESNSIEISDDDCIFCRGVTLPNEYKTIHFCEIVSGVFQAVLDLRGFNGQVTQSESRANGASKCTWVLKQLPD